MKKILAIDPGPEQSAYVIFDGIRFHSFGKAPNDRLLRIIEDTEEPVCIEMIASYGMAVGKEVFETCVWIGRFIQVCNGRDTRAFRKDIKLHLCGSVRAKDANIRAALIDKYGAPGTKKSPGATYGISKDIWSALAVADYALSLRK